MRKCTREGNGETEPDLLAFESIEDMAESSCTSRHASRSSKSVMRASPTQKLSMLCEDGRRRHRGLADSRCGLRASKSPQEAFERSLFEGFASSPLNFPAPSPKRAHSSSPNSKPRHSNSQQEAALSGAHVEYVRVSKDPAHEADYASIHEALVAVAGRNDLVEVMVYPGKYEEPPLLLENNVRLVGLSSSSHLSSHSTGADSNKPVIMCTEPLSPALVSRGTGSLIRNLRFLDGEASCNMSQPHAPESAESLQPADRRGKRPLHAVTERMETSVSFDWSTPPDCQRLPKAKRRGRSNFEDVVSELEAVKGEMEALRSKIREEARGWRSDASVWEAAGCSITGDAIPARVGPTPASLRAGQCMVDVVAGKVEVEDCVWDGRPGVFVSHADAVVRRCSGPGPGLPHCAALRVKGCGNLNLC